MKNLLGKPVQFILKNGSTSFMKVLGETEDYYEGYNEETLNFKIEKRHVSKYRIMGDSELC